jgi:Flp pilus assembly protein TadB
LIPLEAPVAARPHRRAPVHAVITEAAESLPDQQRRRQVRYVLMMGLRVVCLTVAALVVGLRAPYAMVWVTVCIVGMVLLPWMAVLIANDRPPRQETQFRARMHLGHDRELPSGEPKDSA